MEAMGLLVRGLNDDREKFVRADQLGQQIQSKGDRLRFLGGKNRAFVEKADAAESGGSPEELESADDPSLLLE